MYRALYYSGRTSLRCIFMVGYHPAVLIKLFRNYDSLDENSYFIKVAPGPRPVAFVSLNFTDYVSILCLKSKKFARETEAEPKPQNELFEIRGTDMVTLPRGKRRRA